MIENHVKGNSHKETRVGYKAISVLADIVKEYIDAFTVNGRYESETHYLLLYNQLQQYLRTPQDKSSSKTFLI